MTPSHALVTPLLAAVFVFHPILTSGAPVPGAEFIWKADHHMHLASADLCRRVGECLASNDPPGVLASDAVRELDEAHIRKGVILSCAYLYGMSNLHLAGGDIAALVRRENEFVAAQVAEYPQRLVGFLSVDPLQPSAIAEIRHWRGSRQLVGLKLHLTASGVNLRNRAHRQRLSSVLAAAGRQNLPMVIHIGGGAFNGDDAEIFIRDVLPAAQGSWIQIAHAGGGLPSVDGNQRRILGVFAHHIARHDAVTAHVLFDVAYVPLPEDTTKQAADVAQQLREIGMQRFLFGSDFNVLKPANEVDNLSKLHLSETEWSTLRNNCAPWAC